MIIKVVTKDEQVDEFDGTFWFHITTESNLVFAEGVNEVARYRQGDWIGLSIVPDPRHEEHVQDALFGT